MPEFPRPRDEYDYRWAADLVRALEDLQAQTTKPAQVGYSTSNVTATRTIDADTITLAELADVVGTLIDDLKAAGRLA